MNRPLSIVSFFTALALCGTLAGCTSPTTSPSLDAGPAGEDRDGDFLCDARELALGTDPDDPDTDADGFPDGIEYMISTRYSDPTSPATEVYDTLRAEAGASIQVATSFIVTGDGQDYTGSFDDGPGPLFSPADTAADHFGLATAAFIEPPDHAAQVDTDATIFRGVNGRSLLGFEIRFEYAPIEPHDCVRALPYDFEVKSSEGTIVGYERRYLIVAPEGAHLEPGEWCPLLGRDCI